MFTLLFKMRGPNPEILFDPTYLTFQIQQISYLRDNSTYGYTTKIDEIPYENCGNKFPYTEQSVYQRLDLSSYICPKNTDFYLRSNSNSYNFQAIQVRFLKCTGNSCKSQSDIAKAFVNNFIDFAIISSYFDSNDYENPVHHYKFIYYCILNIK